MKHIKHFLVDIYDNYYVHLKVSFANVKCKYLIKM